VWKKYWRKEEQRKTEEDMIGRLEKDVNQR